MSEKSGPEIEKPTKHVSGGGTYKADLSAEQSSRRNSLNKGSAIFPSFVARYFLNKIAWTSFILGILLTLLLGVVLLSVQGDSFRTFLFSSHLPNQHPIFEKILTQMSQYEDKLKSIESDLAGLKQQFNLLADVVDSNETKVTLEMEERDGVIRAVKNDPWVSKMKDDIESLQQQVISNGGIVDRQPLRNSNTVLLLAIGQLRFAIESGLPFAGEWDLVASIPYVPPKIKETLHHIETYRESGVPNETELLERFPDLARSLILAEIAGSESNWRSRMLSKLREVINVRPIGSHVQGNDAGAIAARAEGELLSGNLVAAINLIEGIEKVEGNGRLWLKDAHKRVEVSRALEVLAQESARWRNQRKDIESIRKEYQ